MCGRYLVTDAHGGKRDVFPSETAAVYTAEGRMDMRWGFSLPGGGKRLMINARSESACSKPTFSGLLSLGRCLVPASAYYEWDAQKQPHLFALAGEECLYMAGLYRREQDGTPHFVILTRAADNVVSPVHTRMPCLFSSEEYRHLWLWNDNIAPLLLHAENPVETWKIS